MDLNDRKGEGLGQSRGLVESPVDECSRTPATRRTASRRLPLQLRIYRNPAHRGSASAADATALTSANSRATPAGAGSQVAVAVAVGATVTSCRRQRRILVAALVVTRCAYEAGAAARTRAVNAPVNCASATAFGRKFGATLAGCNAGQRRRQQAGYPLLTGRASALRGRRGRSARS